MPTPVPLDAKAFRQALGLFPSGVTIVCARDAAGEVRAMTASAFMSVSLDPPLVAVAVGVQARMHGLLMQAQRLGISVLAAAQAGLALRFGSKGHEALPAFRFGELAGTPVVDGAVAQLSLTLHDHHRAGDHTLFIARVLDLAVAPARRPLVYQAGGFAPMAWAPPAAQPLLSDFWSAEPGTVWG